jgi:hypothetical protein
MTRRGLGHTAVRRRRRGRHGHSQCGHQTDRPQPDTQPAVTAASDARAPRPVRRPHHLACPPTGAHRAQRHGTHSPSKRTAKRRFEPGITEQRACRRTPTPAPPASRRYVRRMVVLAYAVALPALWTGVALLLSGLPSFKRRPRLLDRLLPFVDRLWAEESRTGSIDGRDDWTGHTCGRTADRAEAAKPRFRLIEEPYGGNERGGCGGPGGRESDRGRPPACGPGAAIGVARRLVLVDHGRTIPGNAQWTRSKPVGRRG